MEPAAGPAPAALLESRRGRSGARDLGAWGAVYTEGWDRRVVEEREVAKRTKETINRQRIDPPRSRDRQEILAAAAPVVQKPPTYAQAAVAR